MRRSLAAVAVASCFAAGGALANPTGPTVTHGTAVFQQSGNVLQITNSPNAIINWQGFSIGVNELTCFIQNSAVSAVLNRVITQHPSQILGALQSNGRVFLINPNGIVFGPNSRIDVSGMVASTLNLSDTDFLTGRMRFTETPGAGILVNQGSLTAAPGGHIYLVAPDVTNSGLITSPGGEVVLAAGKTVELMDPGTPYLRVQVTAPDNQALNLGRIAAESGRTGIFAGLIAQRGAINADGARVGESGKIVLAAGKNTTLEAGSITTASGASGGKVTIQSGDATIVAGVVEAKGTEGQGGTVQVLGNRVDLVGGASIDVSGAIGGKVEIQSADTTLVAGVVEAKGTEGPGGTVQILGNLVGLIGNASVDVSGAAGGGAVLVGGDIQGRNPDIQNASRTTITAGASIRADATGQGDGGRVIVWSDNLTRFYGEISVRGGPRGGDGGFAEVSGKDELAFGGKVTLSAPAGRGGTLLLDPTDITLVAAGGTLDGQLSGSADPNLLFSDGSGNTTLSVTALTTGFASGNTIVLQAANNVNFGLPVALQPGVNLTVAPDADANGAGAFNLSANLTADNLTVSGRMNHTAGALTVVSGSVSGLYDYGSPGIITVNGGTLALGGGMNWSGTGDIVGSGTVLQGSGPISANVTSSAGTAALAAVAVTVSNAQAANQATTSDTPPEKVAKEATREAAIHAERVAGPAKPPEPKRYARLDDRLFNGCRQLDANVYFCR